MKKILTIVLAVTLSAFFLVEIVDAKPFQEGKRKKTIGKTFKKGGKSAGKGGKNFGKKIAKGKPIAAGRDLGKGTGDLGKQTGKGVGKTGKKIGKKFKKIFGG